MARHEHDALAALFDGFGTGAAKRGRLLDHDFRRVIMRVSITGNRHDWFVPFWIKKVATGNRAVVDSEIRVGHHLGDNALRMCLIVHRLGEVDVDCEVVIVAE